MNFSRAKKKDDDGFKALVEMKNEISKKGRFDKSHLKQRFEEIDKDFEKKKLSNEAYHWEHSDALDYVCERNEKGDDDTTTRLMKTMTMTLKDHC